jgi:hypothetical protein
MLEDASIQHLISWSERGDIFRVYNSTTFSKVVLPQYFKHSNWQSFIRQLNSKISLVINTQAIYIFVSVWISQDKRYA